MAHETNSDKDSLRFIDPAIRAKIRKAVANLLGKSWPQRQAIDMITDLCVKHHIHDASSLKRTAAISLFLYLTLSTEERHQVDWIFARDSRFDRDFRKAMEKVGFTEA